MIMAVRLRLGTVLLTVLLNLSSGCAWLPPSTLQAKPIATPGLQETLKAHGKTNTASLNWPRRAWWRDFHDAKLEALIATALQDNPSLRFTATRIREAQALAEFRAGSLLPSVDAVTSVFGQRFSANSIQAKLSGESFPHIIISPLVLRYHLDFWGRDRAALEAALGVVQAREAELAQARILLSSAVARSYFRLVAAIQRLQLAQAMTAALRENLHITEVRLHTGLDSEIPITNAKLRLETALQREAVIGSEIQLLRDQLAALAGKDPDWGRHIEVTASGSPKNLSIPAQLPLRLLAQRPDVFAARARAEALAQEIKVAQTAFYPDVNLAGFAGLDSAKMLGLLFNPSSAAFAFGPVLQLPLFQGGRLEADLKAAEANYDASVEEYNSTLLRAVQEVADALVRWREVNDRLASQQQALSAVLENQRLARVNHETGLNLRIPLLEATYASAEQRFLLKGLEAEHLQVAVQLIEALGGGYLDLAQEK